MRLCGSAKVCQRAGRLAGCGDDSIVGGCYELLRELQTNASRSSKGRTSDDETKESSTKERLTR